MSKELKCSWLNIGKNRTKKLFKHPNLRNIPIKKLLTLLKIKALIYLKLIKNLSISSPNLKKSYSVRSIKTKRKNNKFSSQKINN